MQEKLAFHAIREEVFDKLICLFSYSSTSTAPVFPVLWSSVRLQWQQQRDSPHGVMPLGLSPLLFHSQRAREGDTFPGACSMSVAEWCLGFCRAALIARSQVTEVPMYPVMTVCVRLWNTDHPKLWGPRQDHLTQGQGLRQFYIYNIYIYKHYIYNVYNVYNV